MGGEITVESGSGKGSLLHHPPAGRCRGAGPTADAATMPDDEDELVAMAQGEVDARKRRLCRSLGRPAAETQARKKRILIVDDDRSFLELAERLLLKEGFSAISHQSPAIGAASSPARCRPDAILLDILMPDFDGWAVLETLQARPGHRQHPGRDLEHRRREEAGARRRRRRHRDQARRPRRAAEGGERRLRARRPRRGAIARRCRAGRSDAG